MNKEQTLNKINNSLYELTRALEKQYRCKVFAVTNETRIDCYYKTKRGAEGYIKRNKGFSYYDEQTMEMCYPYDSLEIIEIKIEELTNYNDAELWENELEEITWNNQSNIEYFVNCYIDKVTDETLKKDIFDSVNSIKKYSRFNKFAHKKEKKVLVACSVITGLILKDKEGNYNLLDTNSYLHDIENGKIKESIDKIYNVGDYIINNFVEISIYNEGENLTLDSLNKKSFLSIEEFTKCKENGVLMLSEVRTMSDGLLVSLLSKLGIEGVKTYDMTGKLFDNLLKFLIQGEYTNYKTWIDVWNSYEKQYKINS